MAEIQAEMSMSIEPYSLISLRDRIRYTVFAHVNGSIGSFPIHFMIHEVVTGRNSETRKAGLAA